MALIGTGTTGGGGGSSPYVVQTFSLTAAQLKASTLTPHTIISAQGAGTLIIPCDYAWNYTAGVDAYQGDAIDLVWGNADLNTVFLGLLGAGFAGFSLSTFSAGYAEGGPQADYLNQPLKISANIPGAAVTGTVQDGGSGYAIGDTGTIDDGSPLATYRVDSVAGGGVIDTYTITYGGGTYALGPGHAATTWLTTPGGSQPGAGSGFQVQITSVDATNAIGDGTLKGSTCYRVEDFS